MFSAVGVLSDFLHCFLLRVREKWNHFPLKEEFRATAKPAGGFPGSGLRFHRRRPWWEPFLAPSEFLTTEQNTLFSKCFAKSRACPYSRDLIRTIKGFLFFKAWLHFSRIHSLPLPLQHELYQSPSPESPSPFLCLLIPQDLLQVLVQVQPAPGGLQGEVQTSIPPHLSP